MNTTDKVWNYIQKYMKKYAGCPPTRREICSELNLSSTAVANYHLAILHTQGHISFHHHGRISIVGATYELPGTN